MDKGKVLEKYKKEDDRLLISKLFDRISILDKQNKIQSTDFLSPVELNTLTNVLKMIGFNNYVIYGGFENAQRHIIIIFPDKFREVFDNGHFDYNSICNCIRIKNNSEKYEHKVYLGGILKLGVKREKIGDIVIYEDGADIIVSKDISKFLMSNLHDLTRFQKSYIEVITMENIVQKTQEYEDLKVTVSSLRLDNIVSELARTSRSKSAIILKQERVFINYQNETKATKCVQSGDIITIRGVGKYIISGICGNTRSGKTVLSVKKFI